LAGTKAGGEALPDKLKAGGPERNQLDDPTTTVVGGGWSLHDLWGAATAAVRRR
jgi:hypothetical protein